MNGAEEVNVGAMILSWRGVVCSRTMDMLRDVGCGKALATILSVVTVEKSYANRHTVAAYIYIIY